MSSIDRLSRDDSRAYVYQTNPRFFADDCEERRVDDRREWFENRRLNLYLARSVWHDEHEIDGIVDDTRANYASVLVTMRSNAANSTSYTADSAFCFCFYGTKMTRWGKARRIAWYLKLIVARSLSCRMASIDACESMWSGAFFSSRARQEIGGWSCERGRGAGTGKRVNEEGRRTWRIFMWTMRDVGGQKNVISPSSLFLFLPR